MWKFIVISLIIHTQIGYAKNMRDSLPTVLPVVGKISSPFGYRTSPFSKKKSFHEGLDIVSQMNSPIHAPADALVICVNYNPSLGHYLVLKHAGGVTTRYGHLNKILVKVGQKIKKRTKIATVGMSGRTTGPHLHYEIRLNNKLINPKKFLL